jgi:hypothetical protein
MSRVSAPNSRRQTIKEVRRLESELYRILESEQAVHGYGIEDYLPLIHAIISALYNRGATREAIADAIQVTSNSIYGLPLEKQAALALADRIRREVKLGISPPDCYRP